MTKLYSNSDDLDDNPGIGNPRGKFRCGPLTIHGGYIFAKGGSNAAGIGGVAPILGVESLSLYMMASLRLMAERMEPV